MPMYRTRKPVRKLKGRRFMRKRQALYRGIMSLMPIFTETFSADPIQSGAGGIFQVSFNQIPEYTNYVNLYNNYKILRVQCILIPTQPMNTQSGAIPVDPCRITYAVQSTSNFATPTVEQDVLSDNGCKIKLLTKPIKINFSPKPQLSQPENTGGALVAVTTKSTPFLTTGGVGTGVEYAGVTYWLSQNYASAQKPQVNVYYKVTFQLRDPK